MSRFELRLEPRIPPCDCRRQSAQRVRIAAVAVIVGAFLVRLFAFRAHATGFAACSLAIAIGILAYGIATIFDDTATFPKWVYAAIALVGAGLTFLWAARLF